MAQFEVSKTNQVRQLREKADYDEAVVHQILDAGLVAQVGFIEDGAPLVVPMMYGRDGNRLFLHGARKARVIRMLEATPKSVSMSPCLMASFTRGRFLILR